MAAETAVISLCPTTDRGREILDEFEARSGRRPDHSQGDTRRYRVDGADVDVDAFDRELDAIDPQWRDHITTWRDDKRGGAK